MGRLISSYCRSFFFFFFLLLVALFILLITIACSLFFVFILWKISLWVGALDMLLGRIGSGVAPSGIGPLNSSHCLDETCAPFYCVGWPYCTVVSGVSGRSLYFLSAPSIKEPTVRYLALMRRRRQPLRLFCALVFVPVSVPVLVVLRTRTRWRHRVHLQAGFGSSLLTVLWM